MLALKLEEPRAQDAAGAEHEQTFAVRWVCLGTFNVARETPAVDGKCFLPESAPCVGRRPSPKPAPFVRKGK